MEIGLLQQFRNFLGDEGIITDVDLIAPHLKEWRDRYFGNTPFMLAPNSTEQVQKIVKFCAQNHLKLVSQGGNTGLVGGQIPMGEILLSLHRLNKIREINPLDDCIIAEAGVILENLQNAAAQNNRRFPLMLASQGSATIGGLISTNAGGVHVRKFGMMRQLVLGLEVVLPNGEIYSELSALRKDNTGYDLKQLFIGAEGTLGVITAASLKISARPKYSVNAMLGLENAQMAVECLHALEEQTAAITAFEIMNKQALQFGIKNLGARNPLTELHNFTALVEFEGAFPDLPEHIEDALSTLIEAGKINDATIAQNEAQANSFWHLREGMSAAQKPEGRAAKHDVSVPISKIPSFLDQAEAAAKNIVNGARIVAFGHISDGNIHYDVARPENMPDDEFQNFIKDINHAVNDVVVSLGGSISAEHGIGIARKDEFCAREPKAHLELMKALKAVIDPQNMFNSRNLFS